MSLQRQAILEHVRDLLLMRTDAGANVHLNKAEPDQVNDLPSISVFGVSEARGEFQEKSPVRFMRILKLVAELKIADPFSDDASFKLNTLAEQVERIILRDPLLRGRDKQTALANDCRFQGMDLVIDAQSGSVIAGLADQFEVDYLYEPEEEAPAQVRSLLSVHLDYPLAEDGANDTSDDVALVGG